MATDYPQPSTPGEPADEIEAEHRRAQETGEVFEEEHAGSHR